MKYLRLKSIEYEHETRKGFKIFFSTNWKNISEICINIRFYKSICLVSKKYFRIRYEAQEGVQKMLHYKAALCRLSKNISIIDVKSPERLLRIELKTNIICYYLPKVLNI